MPMITRLRHSAAVSRSSVSQSATGVRKATLAAVDGLSAVPCVLHPRDAKKSAKSYGVDIEFDAMAYFKADADIRPGATATDGLGDRLTVTDENGTITSWLVISTRDPANARKLKVAFLKRSAS